MDSQQQTREDEIQTLLRRLAELQTEELREQGVFQDTPHYSRLEQAAAQLGRKLATEVQQRSVREVAAECAEKVACPTCNKLCAVTTQKREVTSITGPVELLEPVANCRSCRRSFFPSANRPGTGPAATDTAVDSQNDAPGGGDALV